MEHWFEMDNDEIYLKVSKSSQVDVLKGVRFDY